MNEQTLLPADYRPFHLVCVTLSTWNARYTRLRFSVILCIKVQQHLPFVLCSQSNAFADS